MNHSKNLPLGITAKEKAEVTGATNRNHRNDTYKSQQETTIRNHSRRKGRSHRTYTQESQKKLPLGITAKAKTSGTTAGG